ncbi:MAG: hypothetical protein V3W34_01715 [Phycisphaerae bacterium]
MPKQPGRKVRGRHEGTEGRRDEGTEGRRDGGTKGNPQSAIPNPQSAIRNPSPLITVRAIIGTGGLPH